jgi:hypothetical protein
MLPIQDPKSSLYGIIPLPRLVNQQLDARVEEWMAQIEGELLLELQTKIFKRSPADWFTIYLSLFLTLSTLELDTWGLKTWATDARGLLEAVKMLVSDSFSPMAMEAISDAWVELKEPRRDPKSLDMAARG